MSPTILRLQRDATQRVALKSPDGRAVQGQFGPQVMYTLADGRTLYADPALADAIRDLGVAANEPIDVTRRSGGVWDVSRPAAQVAAPAPAPRTTQAPQAPQAGITPITTYATLVASCFASALDGIERAKLYARERGMPFEPTSEDVRATALTLAIQAFRSTQNLGQPAGGAQWQQ